MFKSVILRALGMRNVQRIRYLRAHHRWPSFSRPKTFTEKVFWRKFNDRNPLFTQFSDKLKVRDFVAEQVGGDVLVPLLFETADPADLRKLTSWSDTVIKANHGWRMMEIVGKNEPPDLEKDRIIAVSSEWLGRSHSMINGEMHYDGIDAKIMVERFVGEYGVVPLDCKIHCFRQSDGSTKMVLQFIADRFEVKSIHYYLENLESRSCLKTTTGNQVSLNPLQKSLVEDACKKSKALSRPFDYVRVDWMITKDSLYFSELTFTPGAGLSRSMGPKLDAQLGSLWCKN